jgi:DNA-binding phage protein
MCDNDDMASYLDEIDTATEPTDEVLDAVALALVDSPASPSQIARKAGVRTTEAYAALDWLVANRQAVACGNGAWTKYRNRRFGERLA